jgi:hypothetical protein
MNTHTKERFQKRPTGPAPTKAQSMRTKTDRWGIKPQSYRLSDLSSTASREDITRHACAAVQAVPGLLAALGFAPGSTPSADVRDPEAGDGPPKKHKLGLVGRTPSFVAPTSKALEQCVAKAVGAFFDNDLLQTTRLFLRGAKGSFGLCVTSSLDARRQLVLAARGQASGRPDNRILTIAAWFEEDRRFTLAVLGCHVLTVLSRLLARTHDAGGHGGAVVVCCCCPLVAVAVGMRLLWHETISLAVYPKQGIVLYGSEQAAVKAALGATPPLDKSSSSSKASVSPGKVYACAPGEAGVAADPDASEAEKRYPTSAVRLDLDDLGGELCLLDWGGYDECVRPSAAAPSSSLKPERMLGGRVSLTLVQESLMVHAFAKRLVPLEGNPLVLPLPESLARPVAADLRDIPRVLHALRKVTSATSAISCHGRRRLRTFFFSERVAVRRVWRDWTVTIPNLRSSPGVSGTGSAAIALRLCTLLCSGEWRRD